MEFSHSDHFAGNVCGELMNRYTEAQCICLVAERIRFAEVALVPDDKKCTQFA